MGGGRRGGGGLLFKQTLKQEIPLSIINLFVRLFVRSRPQDERMRSRRIGYHRAQEEPTKTIVTITIFSIFLTTRTIFGGK